MKDTLLRSALLLFVGVALTACGDDDPTDLDTLGTPSDVSVRAYVEMDGNNTYDAGVDQGLAGVTVTLESTLTDNVLTGETDANGLVTFSGVPAGAYNASIDTTDLPEGLTDLAMAEPGFEQSVVAPFTGSEGGVQATFEFRYAPATVAGTIFQDVNRSGAYEADIDTTGAAGVTVNLYAGETATGEPRYTATTDADGTFELTVYPTTYTMDLAADDGFEVLSDLPTTIELAPTAEQNFTILVRTNVITIEAAEAREDGSVVLVEGVVTVAPGTISTSYFWVQDATGGVKVNSSGATFVLGDSLRISGEIVTDFGEKQIDAISIEDLGSGDVPQPVLLDGDSLLTGTHQGELVTVAPVVVDAVGGTSGSYNVTVTDTESGATFVVRVDSDADIPAGTFVVGETYSVSGVSSPFSGAEQIYPRGAEDIALFVPIASARAVEDSTVVAVRGVVHTATGTISGSYFFMHDSTAGTKVFLAGGTSGMELNEGDSIQVTGEKVTRFGEVQIEATSIASLGTGTVRDPIVVTGTELLTGDTQGDLVTVQTVTVTAGGGTTGSYNVTVTDPESGGSFIIRVDSDAGITGGTFVIGNSYTVTGVVSPFSGAQQLYPRSDADIVAH